MNPRPWLLPLAAFALHVATAPGYGYFRDELYYIACSRHLDFGYVDHPPLIALVTLAVRTTLGESLHALRLPSAIAAAGSVALAQATARELGGNAFARLLAGVACALAPVYLALFSFLSMNAFDVLVWGACGLLAIRALRTGAERTWIGLGALAGLGLENKLSLAFFLFGLGAGLLLCRRFDVLRRRGPWIALGLAVLLLVPHLVWQAAHGFPTLEFMSNARRLKMAAPSPAGFVGDAVLQAGPTASLVVIAGILWLCASEAARPYRALGWAFVTILAVMITTGGKPYYLAAFHVVSFAAGAVAVERWTATRRTLVLRASALSLVALGDLVCAPLAKPLLALDTVARYSAWLGIKPSTGERSPTGRLPQFFADMRGWPELAAEVAKVRATLSASEKARACIFTQNYGQAGAIDFFGGKLGLPPAISGHNSYHLWGPNGCTGELVIVVGGERARIARLFRSVELASVYRCADCMPYEATKPIFIARGVVRPISELWPTLRRYV